LTFLAATLRFTVFFFLAGLSEACVNADAASFLISVVVSEPGDFIAFEAIFATAADVFSFAAMSSIHLMSMNATAIHEILQTARFYIK
jgi:hypothetical protein